MKLKKIFFMLVIQAMTAMSLYAQQTNQNEDISNDALVKDIAKQEKAKDQSPVPAKINAKNSKPKVQSGPKLGLAIAIDNTAEGHQRISLAPEFRIGKFGIALDIEFFVDLEKRTLIDRGWVFDQANAVDNLLRKIKYISWGERQDVLFGKDYIFFKLGILDDITLGTGLIFNDFNNSFYYPDRKPLGLNLVVNGQRIVPLGVELVVNDFSEFNGIQVGPIIGTRFFYNFVRNAQLGVTWGLDINQLNAIKDSDGDSYPDIFDIFPFDSTKSFAADQLRDQLAGYGYSATQIASIIDQGTFPNIYSLANQQDSLGIIGLDVIVSLLRDLQVYGHFGLLADDADGQLTEGFGLGIGGISSIFNIVRLQFEYRLKEKNFRFNWFDKNYENTRSHIVNDRIITLDNSIIVTNDNVSHGGFFKFAFNIVNIVNFTTVYEFVLLEQNTEQKLFMDLKLDPKFTKNVPIIDHFSLFYENSRILQESDFSIDNPYLFYGFKIGIDLGGATLNYLQRYSFIYNEQGELIANNKMFIGMGAKF